MNYILNNFLLAQDKFMLEMQLKWPRFSYSACGPSTKNKEIMQNQRRKSFNISERTDIASGDFKDLSRKATSDKILLYKALNIAKNPEYDGYPKGFVSVAYKFSDNNSATTHIGTSFATPSKSNSYSENQQLSCTR